MSNLFEEMNKIQAKNEQQGLEQSPLIQETQRLNAATDSSEKPAVAKKFLKELLIAGVLTGAILVYVVGKLLPGQEGPVQTAAVLDQAAVVQAEVVQTQEKLTEPEPIVETETKMDVPDVPGNYPVASIRRLTETDLMGMSKAELKIMRNEIYARHSYRFQSKKLRSFFSEQGWYAPRLSDVTHLLSGIEKSNIRMIRGVEKK